MQRNLSIATTSGPHNGLSTREVVSLQRSESVVQALLEHDQVVFIERWSLDTSGLYGSFQNHCAQNTNFCFLYCVS